MKTQCQTTNTIKQRFGAGEHALWVNTEPGSIRLHELQQYKLGSLVYV